MNDKYIEYVIVTKSALNSLLSELSSETNSFMEIFDITIKREWLTDNWVGTIYGRTWEGK